MTDQEVEQLKQERDKALAECKRLTVENERIKEDVYRLEKWGSAKCAEMGVALRVADVHLGWGDCSLENVHNIVRHALSTDCGKGYINVKELEPTIELLRRQYNPALLAELTRLERLVK